MNVTSVAGWLLTIALQSALLLAGALAADRLLGKTRTAWRELLWRVVLLGAVAIATLQVAVTPVAGTHRIAVPRTTSAGAVEAAKADAAKTISVTSTAPTKAITADNPPPIVSAPTLTFSPSRTIDWPRWIVSAWFVGVFFALARIAIAFLRLLRDLRGSVALTDARVDAIVTVLAAEFGMRGPRVAMLEGLASPIALVGRRIVLPDWALRDLDGPQLRVTLAHELAHLKRRDPAWKLFDAFWGALFWFVPLAWIARRRLDDLAEIACDALAAQHTQDGRALAQCLVACAERRIGYAAPMLVTAMAARPSAIVHRIERLLEGVAMEPRLSPIQRFFAFALIGAGAFAFPIVGFDPLGTVAPAHASSSVSIHSDDGSSRMLISLDQGGAKLSAQIEGSVAFNADDSDIASLGSGGIARFDETRDGIVRHLTLVERDGKLVPTYSVNGKDQPYDAQAHAWFATLLPALIRESGMGAPARVKRLYEAGGAPRVLDEIARTSSGYARGLYLDLLLHQAHLEGHDLDKAIALAGAIDSDYERRKALTAVIDTQALSRAQQTTFLNQVEHFTTDYERAELLIAVIPKFQRTDETYAAWLNAVNAIHADYEHRRCLQALVDSGKAQDADLARVIAAADTLRSDYEHRELLVAAITRAHDVHALAPAYTKSVGSFSSDYERREALLALLRRGPLDAGASEAVLDAASHMSSDYECREVLVALARAMPDDAALAARYRQVSHRLSDYERDQADRALRR
ncbi:MAG TPA: M56 family metallopeptidase [Rudaea sp.]